MLSKIDHLLDSRKSPNVPKIDITYNTIKLFKFSKSKHTYMWMDAYWEYFLIFKFYFIYFFIQQVLISHQFYTHQCIHVNPNRPIHHTTPPPPPRLSPLGVHMFVLYTCVSTSALQTGSSVPFFQVTHACVNIRYLFFSF